MKSIQITFEPGGGVRIKAEGFKGKECLGATAFLEKALGDIKSSRKTSEYFQAETSRHLNQQNKS